MRGLVQRVSSASVSVDGLQISSVGKGLCVFVGLHKLDTLTEMKWLAKKILSLRLWPNDEGKPWTRSVVDISGEVLLVSQFTLFAKLKGNKPSMHESMGGDLAEQEYTEFVGMVRDLYQPDKVKDGDFGAMMHVELINDGPITMMLETPGRPSEQS